MLAADTQSIFSELARTEGEAKVLVEGLSDQQLNSHPNDRSWSIAQCLDHLARMNTTYAAAMTTTVEQAANTGAGGLILPGWPSRHFIRSMDAPAKQKFKAPKVGVPRTFISGAEALQGFTRSHDELRALVTRAADVDVNRVRFKNPFVPLLRFTVGTGMLVILAHDRRHLWQAEQVRKGLLASPVAGT
jgi:hypothetical protein